MATYRIRKIKKKSPSGFYTVEKLYFFDFFSKRLFTLLTLEEAINKAFSLQNCRNINIIN